MTATVQADQSKSLKRKISTEHNNQDNEEIESKKVKTETLPNSEKEDLTNNNQNRPVGITTATTIAPPDTITTENEKTGSYL